VIDTLFILVENAGRVVTKESLMQQIWPDVTVVESGLTRNISVLRREIEAGMPRGRVIEMVPRRGYRFVADVAVEMEPAPKFRQGWLRVAAALIAALPGLLLSRR
jgi:DNA-binding winged helix-turn-helix (wHTH) protein